MAIPTKRAITDATYAEKGWQGQDRQANFVDPETNLALQNVGRKVRQAVGQGYLTERNLPLLRTTLDDSSLSQSHVWRADVDNINAAKFSYANQAAPRGPPRFCDFGSEPSWGPREKRAADDGDVSETQFDAEDMDQVQPLPMDGGRSTRPLPRRAGLQRVARSMPVGAFAFGGATPLAPTPASFQPSAVGGLTRTATESSTLVGDGTMTDEIDFGEFFTNPPEF